MGDDDEPAQSRAGRRRRTCQGRDARVASVPPAGSAAHRALPRAVAAMISSRRAPSTLRIVPSIVFSATLPVKPSQTITSASALEQLRPSALPAKRSPLGASSACASSVSWLPFSGSSPIERRPTVGLADVQHLLREDGAHVGELERGARAGRRRSRQRRSAPSARAASGIIDRDRRGARRPVAAGCGGAKRRASHPCSRPRRPRRPRPSPTARTGADERGVGLRAHRLRRLLVHLDGALGGDSARARAVSSRAGPKRTGLDLGETRRRARRRRSPRAPGRPRARRRRRGSARLRYGAGARSGSTSRPRYVLHVGQT